MVVWQSDALAVAGLTVELALGAAYVVAARRATSGRGWPGSATAAFLAGLAVLAVVLQSGLGAYDETAAVHVVQHVVLMSVAPLLLALGAPVTLLLRTSSPPMGRRVVTVLHSRPARALCGRRAAWHVPLEYYGLMFVFLLAPVQQVSARNEVVHAATHVLLLTCGLLFWVPLVGRDPAPWRPSARTGLLAALAGLPVNAVLAVAAASWELLAVGEAATLLGIVVVLARSRPASARRRQRARALVAAPAVRV